MQLLNKKLGMVDVRLKNGKLYQQLSNDQIQVVPSEPGVYILKGVTPVKNPDKHGIFVHKGFFGTGVMMTVPVFVNINTGTVYLSVDDADLSYLLFALNSFSGKNKIKNMAAELEKAKKILKERVGL